MRKKTKRKIKYAIYFFVIFLLIYIKFFHGGKSVLKIFTTKPSNISTLSVSGESNLPESTPTGVLNNPGFQSLDETSSNYGFLYGYVTDKFGNPVQNIAVELFPMKDFGMPTYFGKTEKSFTDKDGMYKFQKLNPGFYYFLMFTAKNSIHVSAGDKIRKDFQLNGDGTISGKVVDEDGNPIFPATVYVIGMGWRYREVTQTDEMGKYKVYGLPAGKYFVAVRADGYAISDERNVSLKDGSYIQNIDFVLSTGCVLMGFIKDSMGNPQGGVYISTLRDPRKLGTAFTKSDKNGFYKLENLTSGVNYFVLWKDGSYIRRAGNVLIKEGVENRKDFVFDGTSSIVGSVIAKGYDFIKNPVSVLLFKIKNKRFVNSSVSICDENGDFKFNYLEPGKYQLRISRCSSEYIKGADKTVILDEGEQRDISLKLLKGGILKIKLVDTNGNPISKVSVFMRTSSGKVGFKSLIKPSDNKGNITFSGMAEGKWTLEIKDKDFEPVRKVINISYGDEREMTITLKKGITIHGVVVDKRGNPIPGARIICRKVGDVNLLYVRNLKSDSYGNFILDNVKQGEYVFFIICRTNRNQSRIYNTRVTISGDDENLVIKTNFIYEKKF